MNTSVLGGMRGALAIALVSTIPAAVGEQQVATLTFGVVVLSIMMQGPLLSEYTKQTFGHQETLQKYAKQPTLDNIEGDEEPAPAEGDEELTPIEGDGEPHPAEADGEEATGSPPAAEPAGKDEPDPGDPK